MPEDISGVLADLEEALAGAQAPEVAAAATGSGVATARYVEGLTSEDELRGELQALGYVGPRQDRLVLVANLSRQLDLYRDRRDIWRAQLRARDISLDQFLALLEGAGIPDDSVALERARAEAQHPAAVLQSVQLSLAVLTAEEVPERPAGQPIALSIAVLEAAVVAEAVAREQTISLSLSVLSAAEVPAAPALQPIALSIAALEAEEV